MSSISIPIQTPAVIVPRRSVRNGLFPTATFTHQLIQLTNHVARYRPKEVARYASDLFNLLAGSGGATSVRGRGFFRSSPYASRLWAIMVCLRNSSASPSARIDLKQAGSTISSATFRPGNGPGTATPAFCVSSGPVVFVDNTGAPDAIPTSTDLELVFNVVNGAGLLSAVVYEEALPSDTSNGYVDAGVALLSPIYDATREGVANLVRNMFGKGSAHLFTWTAGSNPSSTIPSTTSATPKNIIDSSTTLSASTPGFTLDLTNCTQLRDASSGVRAVMQVYGKDTTNGNGSVVLKNSAGTTVITVGPFTTTDAWTAGNGYLTAGVDKYDVQFFTSAGTLTVFAVSVYLEGA